MEDRYVISLRVRAAILPLRWCRRLTWESGQTLWFSGMLGVLLLVGPSVCALAAPEADVLLADDAYHYRLFADGQHDGNYLE